MFAIAIWDAKKRQLWLVRDRIGIKPLYYSIHHGHISFASEIRALLCDPDQKRAMNYSSLFHYLSFLTTPAPDTMFEGIKKLPAGTWMRVTEDGHAECREYWDVLDHLTPLVGASEVECAERLLAELRSSVSLHKISDVPVGVFLSGGLDSSSNVALFAEDRESVIKTFTVGYDAEYDGCENEFKYAELMAKHVGAEYHWRVLKATDCLDFFPEMIRLHGEPIADPVSLPLYYLSRLARHNGVTVCQVGEGADELFYGYPGWETADRLTRWAGGLWPHGIKRSAAGALKRILGDSDSQSFEWLRRIEMGQPVFWSGAEGFHDTQKRRLLSTEVVRRLECKTSWDAIRPHWESFCAKAWDPSPLNWMTYADLKLRLPELLLMRVDKMSMAAGLEVRVPYLDHKVVELAMSIPLSAKHRRGRLKHLLKKAVGPLLPAAIVSRPKQAFRVPVAA